jgi:effector-binding domain-containing protein
MTYIVTSMQVQEQPIAVVRRRAAQSQLATVVPAACGEVWSFIRSRGVSGAGRHVAIYLDGVINLEIGVEIPDSFSGADNVYLSKTPAGFVAHTTHLGPYYLLGGAHRAIHDWCALNGRALSGPSWEIYGHWTDDPAKLQTDIFYLLSA